MLNGNSNSHSHNWSLAEIVIICICISYWFLFVFHIDFYLYFILVFICICKFMMSICLWNAFLALAPSSPICMSAAACSQFALSDGFRWIWIWITVLAREQLAFRGIERWKDFDSYLHLRLDRRLRGRRNFLFLFLPQFNLIHFAGFSTRMKNPWRYAWFKTITQ